MRGSKRAALLAASFLTPFALLLGICAVLGLAPFGDGVLMISDARGQYLSYFALYQKLLTGKADWLYSFEKLLGGSLSGLYAYYLASPWNLLLLLFPKSGLALGLDWLIVLKMSACGLTMVLYLDGTRGLRPASLLFTTAYALCGYSNAYAWCVMWLDAVVLLPLIALGIERLWRQGRPLLYILSLGGAIVCCFYTGYMLCLFSVLYFLFLVLRDTPSLRKLQWKRLLRYALASLLAGGLSAGMLLPGFLALRGGVPVSPYRSVARFTYPAALRLLELLLPGRGDHDALVTPTLLLCALVLAALLLGACLLFRKKRDRAGFALLGLLLALLTAWYLLVELPVCRELGASEKRILSKLLLGYVPFWEFYNGSPNLYAGSLSLLLGLSFFFNRAVPRRERFAGLLLLGVLLASACFYLPNLVWHGFEENNCFNYRWSFVLPFVLLLLAERSFGLREGLRPHALWLPGIGCGAVLLLALRWPLWFQENWMLLLCAVFLAAELALLLCWRRGSRAAGAALCAVGAAALCLSTGLSFRDQAQSASGLASLRRRIEAEQARVDLATDGAEGFLRLRKDGTVINYNDPMLFGYPGMVHFSSAEKLSTIRFLGQLGLSTSPNYWANGDAGESRAADTLLGVGRVLSAEAIAGYETLSEGVWRNPWALPLAFAADPAAENEAALGEEPCRNLNTVFSLLTGREEAIFVPAGSEGLRLTVTSAEPLYLQSWSEAVTGCRVLRNGEEYAVFEELHYPNALALGCFAPGDELRLELTGEGAVPARGTEEILFYEDSAALAACSALLRRDACTLEIQSASRLSVRTETAEEKLLVLTLPWDEGWRLRVDGEDAEAETALGVLLAVRLTPGAHTVTLRFVPPGLVPGLAVSACSLCAALAWGLLRKRRGER